MINNSVIQWKEKHNTTSTTASRGHHAAENSACSKKLPPTEFNHDQSESAHECSVTIVQISPAASPIVDPNLSATKSTSTNKSIRTEMHSEWKHLHYHHGEPKLSHHHQGLTFTSNSSSQVLDVNVSVPVAAPVSLTLDDFKKTQPSSSSSSVLSFDVLSKFSSPQGRIQQQDRARGGHAFDDSNNKFSSHIQSGNHSSVTSRTEQNFESNLQEQSHNVLDESTRQHHDCHLAEVSILPDHLDIGDDDNHPPPTPQFDSNAMQQFHEVQPHQVQVDIHNSHYHSQDRHHFHETVIPFQTGGGYGHLQKSIQNHYDCNSQNNGHQHDTDAVENEDEFENTLHPHDTLEVLKATPLCNTVQEFEQKYPADLEMTPPDLTPIQHPTHTDILFGRGGLTNHHPGNKVYRAIVDMHKPDYQLAAKIIKPRVARRIVHAIRHSNIGARFLKKDPHTDMWYDVGDKAASEKTSQALREKSPEEKKAASSVKSVEDSVAAGYSMPSLTCTIGDAIVLAPHLQGGLNTTDQIAAANSALMPSPSPNIEIYQQSSPRVEQNYSTLISAHSDMHHHNPHQQMQQLPVLAYPVEGGTFGTINASGQIVVTNQDILCGRGGATNHHHGNKRFRDIVALHRPDYIAAPKVRKPDVARKIVRAIRMANPPGRFLKKDDNGMWIDIGDKKAAEKCSQALREKGPDARKKERELRDNSTPISTSAITLNVFQANDANEIIHYHNFPDSNSYAKHESATLPDISDDFEHDFNTDRNNVEIDVSPPNPKRFRIEADEVESPLKVHL